ncbi:hypothetical protein HaLaN_27170, partial [Haematococcus lacustris]
MPVLCHSPWPVAERLKGRVVTVSSRAGLTSIIRDPNLRQSCVLALNKAPSICMGPSTQASVWV